MDPVTGTFTSMDTYAGSLSDPMSLHKYLFANSNPVMYSDPSGHSSVSMVECLAVCNLITIMCSVVSYTVEAFIQPNGFETHDASWGLFKRLVQTIIICIIVDIVILLLFVAIDFIAGIIEFVPVGRIISQLQKAADKWGVSSGKDGNPAVNQGIKHYYIYYDENAKRVIDLLTRLGLDPDDFGFNIQSFVKFTDEVENAKNEAIYLGQYYSNGVKTIYYVESASDNRIVVIIEQFGKLQSVMNSDWKSLENMVRKMFGG